MREPLRWCALLAAAWLGLLLAVAAIATPAAFAALPQAEAGRVAANVLAREAQASLILGALLALLLRAHVRHRQAAGLPDKAFSIELGLALGALFCTVAGYYGLQPWMAAARGGEGRLSFAQLHALSAAFYGVKTLLVATLAWRSGALLSRRPSSSG